jgi:hypothetical protein
MGKRKNTLFVEQWWIYIEKGEQKDSEWNLSQWYFHTQIPHGLFCIRTRTLAERSRWPVIWAIHNLLFSTDPSFCCKVCVTVNCSFSQPWSPLALKLSENCVNSVEEKVVFFLPSVFSNFTLLSLMIKLLLCNTFLHCLKNKFKGFKCSIRKYFKFRYYREFGQRGT